MLINTEVLVGTGPGGIGQELNTKSGTTDTGMLSCILGGTSVPGSEATANGFTRIGATELNICGQTVA